MSDKIYATKNKIYATGNNIYAAGFNEFGQLGLGHTDNVWDFEEVGCDSRHITKIICGAKHTFLIKVKICQKCGCCFAPKNLSEEMLMATKIPGICLDMIFNIELDFVIFLDLSFFLRILFLFFLILK